MVRTLQQGADEMGATQNEGGLLGWPARWLPVALLRGTLVGREELARVFSVEVEGVKYRAATDARILIAVEAPDCDDAPFAPEKDARLAGWLAEDHGFVEVPTSELRAFAGPVELPHFCECKHCAWRDDEAFLPEPREGWIGDVRVNLLFVAELLAGVGDETIHVATHPRAQDTGGRVDFRGDGWRGLIMGLRYDLANDGEPRFPLPDGALATASTP